VYEQMIEGYGMSESAVPNKVSVKVRVELLSVKWQITSEGASVISVMNAIITGSVLVAWKTDGERLSTRKEFISAFQLKRDFSLLFTMQETIKMIGIVMFAAGIPGIVIAKDRDIKGISMKEIFGILLEWEKEHVKLKIGSETLTNFTRTLDPWKGMIEGITLITLGRRSGRIVKENEMDLKNLVTRNKPLPPEIELIL
jgi:hypothetical protein